MAISIRGPFGWLSQQPDGSIQSRPDIGPWEEFEVTGLPEPAPIPPTPTPTPPPNASNRDFFMACVADKIQNWPVPDGIPLAQKVLLDLFDPTRDGTLSAAGWSLTPPNANGDRTKVLPLGGVWTRVGFGEGHWVWLEQH